MHLHKFGVSALAISSLDGCGFFLIKTFACITIPGMQNPHCTPHFSTKALAITRCLYSPNPSVVTTTPFSTLLIGITQDNTALPLSSTVQAPQAACGAHPSFADVIPSISLRYESKGNSGLPL